MNHCKATVSMKELGIWLFKRYPKHFKNEKSAMATIHYFKKRLGIEDINGHKNYQQISLQDAKRLKESVSDYYKGKAEPMEEEKQIELDELVRDAVINRFDFSNLSKDDIMKLKKELDDLVLSMGPDWENMKPGEKFNYRGWNWVCLDPNFSSIGGTGCLAIMADLYKEQFAFAKEKNNEYDLRDYALSDLRSLLSDLAESLQNDARDVFIEHEADLTMENGDDDFKPVMADVFPLSIQEYIKYAKYVPRYEGAWWLRSPHPWYASSVRIVTTDGSLPNYHAFNGTGVAPACIFNRLIENPRR